MHPLAGRAQRLATGREDVNARRRRENPFRQIGNGLDDVLAIVEHEQYPIVPKRGDQGG